MTPVESICNLLYISYSYCRSPKWYRLFDGDVLSMLHFARQERSMAKDPRDLAARVLAKQASNFIAEGEELRENLLALLTRDEEIVRGIDDCLAGARALGHPLDFPVLRREGHERNQHQTYITYRGALRNALIKLLETQRQRLAAAVQDDSATKDRPAISEIVLERLLAAGDVGSKAADIREFIEKTYDIEIHEKTAGMTLYRLQVQGKVRREGHTWFFVPQSAETKNPGVAAPGPNHSESDQKGGA